MRKTSQAGKNPSRRYGRASPLRRWPWGWIGVGLTVLVIVGLVVVLVVLRAGREADIPGVQAYSSLSAFHTTSTVRYNPTPPVGGDHDPELLNCGIYGQPVRNENAVHSLEHGAVWITYQPTLPASAVEQLRGLVRGHGYVILSPYPNLPSPVVASAWGVQLLLTGADDARLPRFIAKYEQGSQTPERGAPCSGGVGTPIGH